MGPGRGQCRRTRALLNSLWGGKKAKRAKRAKREEPGRGVGAAVGGASPSPSTKLLPAKEVVRPAPRTLPPVPVRPMAHSQGGGAIGTHKEVPALTESEEEFLAEDEVVQIVPNFSMDTLKLICGSVGPFRPQIAVEVPLWLALALKKRHKCSIQTPQWMSADNLVRVLEEERNSEAFQPLPYHYIEQAELLFLADQHGRDVADSYKVRTLIQDIRDVRHNKIQAGLKRLQAATSAVKLSNLAAMEVTVVRPFFCSSLAHLYKLDNAATAASQESSFQPQQGL